jgi:predicted PurR-regulated permease PerM
VFFAAAIAVLMTLFFFYYKVIIPILVGGFFSYFLSPWVDTLQRKKVSRALATSIVLLLVIGVVTFLVTQLGPMLYEQLRDLFQKVPVLLESLAKGVIEKLRMWLLESGFTGLNSIDRALRKFNLLEQSLPRFQGAIDGLWTTGASIMGSLFSLILTPFVTFYLVYEKPRIVMTLKRVVPRDIRPYFLKFFKALDLTLRAVVRGHIKVAATLSVLYTIGFYGIGISTAVAIGVAAGMCRVIPYFDAFVGILLGATYVFTNDLPPSKLFAVLAVVGAVQVIDGAIITPKLIGSRVGLHPAIVILTIIAAGYHLGFWGVLLAIPLAASIKTIVGLILPVYRDSTWFRGS